MLDNCQNAKERWGGVHQLIDRWLKERQELLVHYCDLSDTARGTPSEDVARSWSGSARFWWTTRLPVISRSTSS